MPAAAETAMPSTEPVFIGSGRSARVFRLAGPGGAVARKVFLGSTAANLVHSAFYGAPLDYRWCEAAVRAAFFRRRVLSRLVPHWFGARLDVSDATGWGLDEQRAAYYLDTVFVDGHPSRVYSPFFSGAKTEVLDLQRNILPALQHRLIDAGFVGTVWQAGKGHPCAIPNFLCTDLDPVAGRHRWSWIDLESGVPAIASCEPVSLFGYYIPQAIRRRRILFDDLDEGRLRAYLQAQEAALKEKLGAAEFDALRGDVENLVAAHAAWSGENRVSRSVKYFRFRGRISERQYDYYLKHPLRWYPKLFLLLARLFAPRLWQALRDGWPKFLRLVNPVRWIRFLFNLVFSRSFRVEISRKFVRYGIGQWREGKRLTAEQVSILEAELTEKEANQYLADFGVHLAMKPVGYLVRLTVVPVLWQVGLISPHAAAVLFVFCGMILRVTYSFCRCVEDLVLRHPPAWLAMAIACVPTLGTLGYPCQMIHSARRGHLISQFIIYESCSTIAEHIPIWGGRDTGWDHLFNRLAHGLIHMSEVHG
ncbi:MAG: hypothetical protein V1873_08320 [Verrucomicrobiota bacterium]